MLLADHPTIADDLLDRFTNIFRRMSDNSPSVRCDAEADFASLINREYDRLEALGSRASRLAFAEDRSALRLSLRRARLVFDHIRSGSSMVLYEKGTVVEHCGYVGIIMGFEMTSLGMFYQFETEGGDMIEIFAGLQI